MFDVEIIFSCPCFVSKIQKVRLKSRKIVKLLLVMVRFILIILRKRGLFLFVVFIISWVSCNLIPATVFTIIKGLILKCVMTVVCIRQKNIFDVIQ